MGPMLAGLLRLQLVERKLAQERSKLRTQEYAVAAQQRKIEQAREEWTSLHDNHMDKRKGADRLELELAEKEELVSKLRTALNTARTNKEYAAILTRINTIKADNANIEEGALNLLQEVDVLKAEVDQALQAQQAEEQRLSEVKQTSAEEIATLTTILEDLTAKREEAAKDISPDVQDIFRRAAEKYDGEAMAAIGTQGDKPPHTFVCGGCFMGLNAEHSNALQVRDEIRTCDNCGRILYLQEQAEETPAG